MNGKVNKTDIVCCQYISGKFNENEFVASKLSIVHLSHE